MSGGVKGALIVAVTLVLIAVAAQNEGLAFGVAPIVFMLLVYVMTQVPLRYSLMTLLFLACALENPDESPADGQWKSPFYNLGAVMLTHLNTIDRSVGALSWCSFSGMDLCLLTLIIVATLRKSSGSKIDGRDHVGVPKPLMQLFYVSIAGTMYIWLNGLVRGGNFSMSLWQLNRVMYLPMVFFLFERGLRGPEDGIAVGKVVLGAAVFRALLAIYVYHSVTLPPDDAGNTAVAYATSHADSMLFAIGVVLLVAVLLEKVPKKVRRRCLLLVPLISWGIIDNGRRMAWVQVAFVLLTVYPMTKDNPIKRKIQKILPFALGVFAVYAAIGWGSKSAVFKPVQMMQSIVDPKTDASSLWREIENYDIISSFRMNPVMGAGYGNGYVEFIGLPAVPYPLEHFCPHNSLLGLWCFCGYIGYTALTLWWVVGVYFAMRAHAAATEPFHRIAAVASFGAVLVYFIQCWGDMGLGAFTGVFIVGPAIAVGGNLAMVTGEWGSAKERASAKAPQGRPAPRTKTARQVA